MKGVYRDPSFHSFSATLQWQRPGTNLPGLIAMNLLLGTVSLADSGSVFRCIAVNFACTTTTTNAVLRVVPDGCKTEGAKF